MSQFSLNQLVTRRELGYGLQLFTLGMVLGAHDGRIIGQQWFLAVILCLMVAGGWMIRSKVDE
jgi:hypothetical protein